MLGCDFKKRNDDVLPERQKEVSRSAQALSTYELVYTNGVSYE